jgi:predicted porin
MKKHIIAAAVSAAFAVPAVAQVTISGNLEAGYVNRDLSATMKSEGVGKMVGTPNLTFSGSEDLGGGLKANFRLTYDIDTSTGAKNSRAVDNGETSASSTSHGQFDIATVGVSGGFGSIAFGKNSHATRDLGGVYRFLGDIGRLTSSLNSDAYVNNTLQYVTPSFSGFTASVGYSSGGKQSTGGNDIDVGNGSVDFSKIVSMGVSGSFGAAKVGAARETSHYSDKVEDKQELTSFGGSYDLGVARLGAIYAVRDTKVAGSATVQLKATGIHAAAPVGPVTVGFSYTQYKTNPNSTDIMTLGGKYDLSKRTALFASYQTVKAGTGTVGASARGLGVAETAGRTNGGYGLTVVHSF